MDLNGKAAVIVGSLLLAPAQSLAFSVGDTWDWQLTEPAELERRVDVLDLHPDLVSPGDLRMLEGKGIQTICYVSVGTLENDSADKDAFPKEILGKTYEDWPDERFLDIRRLDVLVPIMAARFGACKRQGFSAVEPDNMDVHDNDSGFPVTDGDVVRYVTQLASVAHGLGLKIGQKNVPELTGQLVSRLDFVIAESCFQDEWCEEVTAYIEAGKPVFDAEYTDRPIDFPAACKAAETMKISMILKNRDLTAPLQSCP